MMPSRGERAEEASEREKGRRAEPPDLPRTRGDLPGFLLTPENSPPQFYGRGGVPSVLRGTVSLPTTCSQQRRIFCCWNTSTTAATVAATIVEANKRTAG